MSTDVKSERNEQLERFVKRSALGLFLTNLVGEAFPAPFGESDLVAEGDDLEVLAISLSGPLFNELWPDESSQSTAEFALALGRECLQASHIFSRLADAAPFLREQADYFRLKAAEEFLSAQQYVAEQEGDDA